ncbi:MAG: family 20 glycosylhydrolase [Eubacteriales bacterium]|nr:family 20 glycosylhydrolase [Eubacteriales bacterium]
MKTLKKALSLLLVLCMVLGMTSFIPSTEVEAAEDDGFYKIVHLDCGRKYFTVGWVKSLIDEMEKDGYTHLELAFGNDGLRFLLDDMSVTVDGTTYSSDDVKVGIQAGNKAYYDAGTNNEWSEAEMGEIITYANANGIEIIPLLNTPGHMDAIIDAMESVSILNPAFTAGNYGTSARTVDLENDAAVAFTQALVQKYIKYFAGKGCSLFNLGTDEYANDILINYSGMGFGYLQGQDQYGNFVNYVNTLAAAVTNAGMTPMAFNDGIYYGSDTSSGIFNKDIMITYWSNGWGNYKPASADFLANQGHNLINTHGDFYYVLGKSDNFDNGSIYASNWNNKAFPGTTFTEEQAGAMFCIWCDYPNAETEDQITGKVINTGVLSAMSTAMGYNDDTDDGSDSGDENTGDEVKVTNNETITVTVGEKATATIDNANYAGTYTTDDSSIATVSVTGEDAIEATVKYESASPRCSNLISNNSTSWKETRYYYQASDGNYYPVYVKRSSSWSWGTTTYTYTWGYSATDSVDNVTQIRTQSVTNTNTPVNITVYTKSGTEAVPASTTVTFTGVAVGTTYVTVGNTKYTINVIAEDLSKVTPLTVEYWITNRQVTANGATSGTIAATASGVYSESGALFSSLVPETGTQDSNTMVFWKGTCLDSSHKQTATSGVDMTTSGSDFTYIRYWNGSWAYSADRETWTIVENDDQIVAYYLQKTEVTDEVTTEVVDWGVVPSTSYNSTNYVLIDFAVKYESGERTPDSFPVSNKTMAFHCDPNDSTTVHQYNNGNRYSWSDNYRDIGMIKAEETDEYEVYMITVTPTSDSQTTQVAGNANSATSYTYDGTEKVVWVDDEANLGDFADESSHYTSISGDINYSVGGEAIVPGLEIFNRHGMLVTYYVRAKVTEDSLAVHYIDKAANQEFYNYNIAVRKGTTFDASIALADSWKGDLKNGNVTNLQDKTQTVSADLSTMPAIGAQYRYSDYTCVEVVRSENGKNVYLYYTFNNAHSFVVDFGLPLNISKEDLGISGDWSSVSVTGAKYGTVSTSVGEGITYTPDKVFRGVERLQLTLTGNAGSTTQQIYIYPATTVYYEEGFAEYSGNWGENISKGTAIQATEAVEGKKNVYGYDTAYAGNVGASANSQATSSAYGDKATFTFTGTGVGIYANCTTGTGRLMIQVKNADTNKLVQVETALLNGNTENLTIEQDVTGYNVPVTVFKDLAYDTYTVTISHIKTGIASVAGEEVVNLDGFRVYNTLGNTAEDTYIQDEEDKVSFTEVRDLVLSAVNLSGYDGQYGSGEEIISQVFSKIDTGAEGAEATGAVLNGNSWYSGNLQDLIDNGPKNEVYLFNNQTLLLNVKTNREIQIGLKALNEATTYTVNAGESQTLNSSTDMFYKVEKLNDGTITITNTGSGILSVTMLKICDAPADAIQPITEDNVKDALTLLGYVEPEASYADAALNITLKDVKGNELASTALTANGTVGETTVFSAEAIEEAAAGILPEGYELTDASYSDVEVAYGESADVSFSASEKTTTSEEIPSQPANILKQIVTLVKNFFGKLFGH